MSRHYHWRSQPLPTQYQLFSVRERPKASEPRAWTKYWFPFSRTSCKIHCTRSVLILLSQMQKMAYQKLFLSRYFPFTSQLCHFRCRDVFDCAARNTNGPPNFRKIAAKIPPRPSRASTKRAHFGLNPCQSYLPEHSRLGTYASCPETIWSWDA